MATSIHSLLWCYFTQDELNFRIARCKKCNIFLSALSKGKAMRSHLRMKHPELYTLYTEQQRYKGGNDPKWTYDFIEQFAREWLKHECLLPNWNKEGLSQFRIKVTQACARREMYANLGLPQHRPWYKHFLDKYKQMLTKMVANKETYEEALAAAPQWVQECDAHFDLMKTVFASAQPRTAPSRSQVLTCFLISLWRELRNLVERDHTDIWTEAIEAVAKEYNNMVARVTLIWNSVKKVALQKLNLLLSSGDKPPVTSSVSGPSTALSIADWLAVDLLLLYHPQVILLNQDSLRQYDQLATLTTLFSLAQLHHLDEWLTGTATDCETMWNNATTAYVSRGYTTSMVVLQRRWYELVLVTRAQLERYRRGAHSVPPLCRQLARRFPDLMTSRLPTWTQMVRERRVVTPDYTPEYTLPTPSVLPMADGQLLDHNSGLNDDDDDIILIEKHIETIELDGLDSEDEDVLIVDETLTTENNKQIIQLKDEIKIRNMENELRQSRTQNICTEIDKELDSQLKHLMCGEQSNLQTNYGDTGIKSTESRERELCMELDIEMNNQLKEIQDQNNKENNEVTSSIDWSLFSKKKTQNNAETTTKVTEIHLVNSENPDELKIVNEASSLQTEIILNENDDPQETVKVESQVDGDVNELVEETNNTMDVENANTEKIFEELDPSKVEMKIIFSDDEDESIDTETLNDVDSQITNQMEIPQNVDKNKEQMPIDKVVVKSEATLDNNSNINCVINLDTDSSDSDKLLSAYAPHKHVSSSEALNASKTKDRYQKDVDKPESSNSSIEPVAKKKDGNKKKRIGPKSFMERQERLIFDPDKSDLIPSESIATVDTDKTDSRTDKDDGNEVPLCKKEAISDDEDSNLVIIESNELEDIKKESDADDNNKLSPKLDKKDNGNKNTEDVESKASSVKAAVDKSQNVEENITTKPSRVSISFESDNAGYLNPVVAVETDKNTPANNDDHSNKNKKVHSEIYLKAEKIETNAGGEEKDSFDEDEADDLLATFQASDGVDIQQLLSPAQIPLYKIDDYSFWKNHSADSTINITKINNKLLNPPSRKRLKLATEPVEQLTKPSYEQSDLPERGLAKRSYAYDLWKNQYFSILKDLDADFVVKYGPLLSRLRPVTVDIERLPMHIMEDFLKQQSSDQEDLDSSRRKIVKLSDIEEVRRINRRLLTAQVRPIVTSKKRRKKTVSSDSDSDSDASLAAEPEPDRPMITLNSSDNALTPQELKEVLNKLKKHKQPPSPKATNSETSKRYCCAARRHINYNRAKSRNAARAGKSYIPVQIHDKAGKEHASMKCECCCLSSLREQHALSVQLAHDVRTLNDVLRTLIAPPGTKTSNHKNKPLPDPAPSIPISDVTETTVSSVASSLVTVHSVDKSAAKGVEKKRHKASIDRKRKRDRRKQTEEEEKKKEEQRNIDYEEWTRQRNLCSKYFHLSHFANTSKPVKARRIQPTQTQNSTADMAKGVEKTHDPNTNKVTNTATNTTTPTPTETINVTAKLNQFSADELEEVIRHRNLLEHAPETAANLGSNNTEPTCVTNKTQSLITPVFPLQQVMETQPSQVTYGTIEIVPMETPRHGVQTTVTQQIDLTKDDEDQESSAGRSRKSSLDELIRASAELKSQPENVKQQIFAAIAREQSLLGPYLVDATTQQPIQLSCPPMNQTNQNSSQGVSTQKTVVISDKTKNQTDTAMNTATNTNQVPNSNQSNAITQPQLKEMIKSSMANPGSELVSLLQSPCNNATVIATCKSKPDNPNQSTLRVLNIINQQSTRTITTQLNPAQDQSASSQVSPSKLVNSIKTQRIIIDVHSIDTGPLSQTNTLTSRTRTSHQPNLLKNIQDDNIIEIPDDDDDDDTTNTAQSMPVISDIVSANDSDSDKPTATQTNESLLNTLDDEPTTSTQGAAKPGPLTFTKSILKPGLSKPLELTIKPLTTYPGKMKLSISHGVNVKHSPSTSEDSTTMSSPTQSDVDPSQSTQCTVKPTPSTSKGGIQMTYGRKIVPIVPKIPVFNMGDVKKTPSSPLQIVVKPGPSISTNKNDNLEPSTPMEVNVMPGLSPPLQVTQGPSTSMQANVKPSTSEQAIVKLSTSRQVNVQPSTSTKVVIRQVDDKPSTSRQVNVQPSTPTKVVIRQVDDKPSTSRQVNVQPSTSTKVVIRQVDDKPSTSMKVNVKPSTSKQVDVKPSTSTQANVHPMPECIQYTIKPGPSAQGNAAILQSPSLQIVRISSSGTPIKMDSNPEPSEANNHSRCSSSDISTASPQYIKDIVNYIRIARIPYSEVQILNINPKQPLLKIRDKYLVVTDRIKPGELFSKFCTLNPVLNFREIYFKKPNAKKIGNNDVLNTGGSKETSNEKTNIDTNTTDDIHTSTNNTNVDTNNTENSAVKLKIKEFAKLPGYENALTLNESDGDQTDSSVKPSAVGPEKILVDPLDFMYVDDKCFRKLSDDPLIYATVFMVLSDLSAIEEQILQKAPLYLLDIQSLHHRNQRRLVPMDQMDLEVVKELVEMLNNPSKFTDTLSNSDDETT